MEGLRKEIHMKMLAKSENAKDCGELTVIPLGHAVTIAEALIAQREKLARMQGWHEGRAAANNPEYQHGYSTGEPEAQLQATEKGSK